MKNLFAIGLGLLFLNSYSQNTVPTKKIPSPYSSHGITISDDYSWLESIKSPETTKWTDDENKITAAHLDEIRKKYNFEKKITEYNSHESGGLPRKKGKYFYSVYLTDDKKPPSLFYRKKIDEKPMMLLNPSEVLESDDFLLGDFYPSKSSSLLAYMVSRDGSDRTEIRFMDINKKSKLEDVVTDVKFSEAQWNLDLGVFYKKNININKIAADSTNQLFYHKLGTRQSEDKLIFDNSETGSFFRFYTTRGKLIIIDENQDTDVSSFYQATLAGEDFVIEKFFEDKTGNMKFLDYRKGQIYYSSKEFDWGEIRSFSIDKREEEKVIVPQIYSQLLLSSHFTEDYIFCQYKTIGKECIRVYDPTGKFIRKFDTPDGFGFHTKYYDDETKSLYVTLESYVSPSINYKLNVETGEFAPYYNTYLKAKSTIFPTDYFETKCTTYKSRDNKDVPITIVYKKGTKLDGNNPTLLRAYGGFGLVSSPDFSPGLLCFLDNGGVFAYAEIRGGGEKGWKWEKDGKNLKKMNSFNDFIDAAEYLIKEKYTSPSKLAINGGSYGGLVVGVAMTKRPELFKVAIPEMGALDMIKFNQYTVGRYHLSEFGNPENKEEFDNLKSYSPYHNIDEKTNYPITLIITSDNDDRVPPLHSFKFAAKLQNRESQKNPIYLETFSNSGHYGQVSTFDRYVKSEADFYGFLLYHLNN
jgi:prolyl oligopeptidase